MAKTAGGNPRTIPEGKKQVNFNASVSVIDKLNQVAFEHNKDNAEVYNLAFERFIEQYEKKNGPIKPGSKKKDIKL